MADVIRPVARPVPLRQTVYDALVELIVGGVLQPGQRMVEAELARQLGVSRQPIREAFHRLEAEGWVDLRPGQGAFVHTPTEQEVDQLLDVRGLLESEAARLAAGAAAPADVAALRAICRRGVDALDAGDPERIVDANAEFHAQVRAISGNVVLAELIGMVDRRVRWYYRRVVESRGRESWTEHADLVEAIEAHDEPRAAAVARRHTERTRDAYHATR
ncbi:GntR family transcriptional regulator [Spirillospora sp. NPDC048911]|uniref:GntR family transcriptional regulator n=1 Tax=Spirillospora sp. NPDC048911 TaxID=3364527 RepID=UPI00371882F1